MFQKDDSIASDAAMIHYAPDECSGLQLLRFMRRQSRESFQLENARWVHRLGDSDDTKNFNLLLATYGNHGHKLSHARKRPFTIS